MAGASAPNGSGRIVGRYVLYDEIATGGMATIHIGRLHGEVGFSRPVAIKRLLPQFARDPEFVAMFLEEARLAARIRHPNVVPVLDVVSEGEELFLVMEFIQGETVTRLTRVSRERARIVPMPVALAITVDMLQGLHAAHEATDEYGQPLHIVHRDISPHNVMVGKDGVARVLDFGIAKASSSSQSTREGEVKGKFAYMSPEQLSSTPVDRRADVFAASIVLWEMLTGGRLFQAPDPAAIVGRVLTMRIPPPSELAAGIPPLLDQLVLKGLARDVNERFRTASDMAQAVERLGIRIARPNEVGTWVNRIAGDTLKKRARRIAEIESTGSFSMSNSLVPPARLSDRPIDNTGSGSSSRSGLRPRSEPSVSSSLPSLPPDASASSSLPVPALGDDIVVDVDAPKKRSGAGLFVLLVLASLGGGAGYFVWKSGGVGPARAKIYALLHPQPHGVALGAPQASAAAPAASNTTTDTSGTAAEDVTAETEVIDTTTGHPIKRRHVRFGGAAHHVPAPHVATHAPVGAAGGGGNLGHELANASGGGIGVGKDAVNAHVAAPSGDLPTHPSQGQVQAALIPLLRSARACFAPDSPQTHATITFGSSGAVTSVAISGFAKGRPEETCVRGMLAKAHVDPFSDPSYSVPFTIRP
jgi:serine/threonine protein kinase